MRYECHLQTRISKSKFVEFKRQARMRDESLSQYFRRRTGALDWSDVLSAHPMSDREIKYALLDMPHERPWHEGEESVTVDIRLTRDELREIEVLAIVEGQSRAAYARGYIDAILENPEIPGLDYDVD